MDNDVIVRKFQGRSYMENRERVRKRVKDALQKGFYASLRGSLIRYTPLPEGLGEGAGGSREMARLDKRLQKASKKAARMNKFRETC